MSPRVAILSLGSNRGDRLAWLKQAGLALLALPESRLTAVSPVYESDPVGVPADCRHLPFLNCVALLETGLGPHDLLAALGEIEAALGRTRGAEEGLPRTIDIDIVALGGLMLHTPTLTLPHPRAHLRRFVLQPLADVWPDYTLPGNVRTVADLLLKLPQEPRVWLFDGSSCHV